MEKTPKFIRPVCNGDRVQWCHRGYDLTAVVEYDHQSHVDEYDCYSPDQIAAWQDDQWCYYGLVIIVSKNGVKLTDCAASIWGVESDSHLSHFADLCVEMQDDAIEAAKIEEQRIIKALTETN